MDNKLLAAGGILAIAATIGLSEIDTSKTVEPMKLTVQQEIATKQVGEEILALRTENKEVFKAKNGKLQAKIYSGQKYYFDSEDMTYKQPDLTVKEVSTLAKLNPLKTHDKYVDAGRYKAVWLDSSPNNYTIYGSDDNYIGYTALFDDKQATGETVQQYNGMKQTWTIADSSINSLSWLVKSDLRLVTAGKAVIGRDEYGADKMTISEPVAWDKNGVTVPVFVYLNSDTLKYAVFPPKGCVWPVTIDPTTQINDILESGRLSINNATYLTARNATDAGIMSTGYFGAGQYYDSGTYTLLRGYTAFVIPPMTSILACSLYVYGDTDLSDTDFNMNIYGARSYKSVFSVADYSKFNGWAASGAYGGTILNDTWSSASYSATWNKIVLNSAGRDSVFAAKGDTLWIALLSSRDVSATQPSGWEYVGFKNVATKYPYLSLTYQGPTINPPTEFLMTPIAGAKDSLLLSWTNNYSSSIDSLILYQWPDSVRKVSITKTATSYRLGGLNPYTKYKFYIRADSAGVYGYSNADSAYTTQTFKTENFYMANAGYAQNAATARYDSARTESKADSLSNGATYLGQWKSGATFYLFRHFQDFVIPKANKILAESLFVKGIADSTSTDFTINAYSGFWNGGTPVKSKYFIWDGWALGQSAYTGILLNTTFNTSGFTTGAAYNKIVFNQAGRDSTLKAASDTLQIILLSSRDVAATAPTNAEFITMDEANSYMRITYAPPDTAPTGFQINAISKDSLLATWVDHSYSERGFIVIDETTGLKLAGTDTTEASVQSLRIGALLPNRGYGLKVKAVGGSADGLTSAADSCYTLPAVPVISPLVFVVDSLLKVVIDTTGVNNPPYTEYAIQDSLTGLFIKMITGIDTFSTDTTWATYNTWGAAGGDTVRAGVGKKYYMRIMGRSGQ